MSACDLPVRRPHPHRMVDGIRSPHRDAAPLKQRGEIVQLALGLVEKDGRYRLAAS